MSTYKSKHTGERVDNAVTKIPESLPTEDSFIVVKADGSASEYIPQSQVSSDKLDKQTAQTASDQIYGKLADGSQTMFDVTMGAEPTTIPRRDTAGRVQVADGVSGNDAVNFNQLQVVESSILGLNIQNGSGTKAIQQKQDGTTGTFDFTGKNPNATALDPILTGQIPYGATGDFAVSFGGKSAAQGKRSVSAGTTTIAKGKYSAAFGDNSVALGNESFAAGYATVTKGARSAAFGENNQALADNVFIAGQNSKHEGMNGTSFGQSNIGHFKNSILLGYGVEDSAENQIVIGSNFKADSDALFQVGTIHSSIKVDNNGTLYAKNQPYSIASNHDSDMVITPRILPTILQYNKMGTASFYQSLLVGRSDIGHTDIKPTILSIGQNNAITDGKQRIVVVGNQHSINKDDTVAFGWALQSNNRSDSNSYTEALFGHYNKMSDNVLLQVGNGTGDLRSNAFEVFNDGRAKVHAAPKDANDVVRKLELDTKYDKAGGTIGGNVIITGDLTVNGTQHINNTENLNVENAMIYSNAKGATLATNGGIGIKKNATDVYGIVYDPTSDSVKLGIGKSDANGRFTFNANEGQPVAIRDDSSKFTNNHIIKWDSTNHKLVDSGKKIGDLGTATNLENGTGTSSVQQKQDGTTGTFDFTGKNPNATNLDPTLTGQIPYGSTGDFASSFGGKGAAQGKRSFQVGTTTIAKGAYSAAFGDNSVALGSDSFVEGYQNTSAGTASHAEGHNTLAQGDYAHTEGIDNKALGRGSHVEGNTNIANDSAIYAHVEGSDNITSGIKSHIEGGNNTCYNVKYTSSTSGGGSSSGGSGDTPSVPSDFNIEENYGNSTHIEGSFNNAYGFAAHVEGGGNSVRGHYSHAEGDSNTVTGKASHIEGEGNIIEGDFVHVSGSGNSVMSNGCYVAGTSNHIKVSSNDSAVFGLQNNIDGSARVSFVTGEVNSADFPLSAIFGSHNRSDTDHQLVAGYYSKDPAYNCIVKIGNGTASARSNAFEVLQDGRAKVSKAPIDVDDVVRKKELDAKLDNTGGTIGGNVDITGNLTVQKKLKCETAPTENNDVLRYQDIAVEVETSLIGA